MTKKKLLVERIKAWREDDAQGYHTAIGLLCEAEDALLEARAAFRAGWYASWTERGGWNFEGIGEGVPDVDEEVAWTEWTKRKAEAETASSTDSKPTSTE
jgi:hypothetical protein